MYVFYLLHLSNLISIMASEILGNAYGGGEVCNYKVAIVAII